MYSLFSRAAAARSLRPAPLLGLIAALLSPMAAALPAHAQTVITTDTTIDYAINDFVKVSGSPLVAVVSGGYIGYSLETYDTSRTTVSGNAYLGGLLTYGTSTVTMSGGSIFYNLYTYQSSKVSISGGDIWAPWANDTSTITVSGGSVGGILSATQSGTITVSGGSVSSYGYLYDSSTLNISGGFYGGEEVKAYDSSTLNVSGGSLATVVYAHNDSTINVSGGILQYGVSGVSGGYLDYGVSGTDFTTINVSGGSLDVLAAGGHSTLNVSGGTIGQVSARESSTYNVSGGTITYVVADGNSTVNVSGGSIGGGGFLQGDMAFYGGTFLHVFGSDLSLSGLLDDDRTLPYYHLTGTLADGTPIDNRVTLYDGANPSQIVLHNRIYAAPVVVNDSVKGDRKGSATVNVLANDLDTFGRAGTDTLTVSAVTNGGKGTVVSNGDGTLSYTRNLRAKGNLEDSFTYTVSDGFGGTATATVFITTK